MTIIAVEHETRYEYEAPVEVAHHLTYLRPVEDAHQQIERFEVTIDPAPSQRTDTSDVFGNQRLFFAVTVRHASLLVRMESRVSVADRYAAMKPEASPPWETVRDSLRYAKGSRFDAASEFVMPSPFVPRLPPLGSYAGASFTPGRPLALAALDLMHRIRADFKYASNSTQINTPLIDAFKQRRGVCQDFSHLMIGALRELGLAARYVSGYLLTRPTPGKPKLRGADASHAWAAVYCPGIGAGTDWLELDPTNDVVPQTGHVRLSIGRDYGDVTPLKGVIRGGGEHELTVSVHTESIG